MHFIYNGKNSVGETVNGKIEAVSRDAAQDTLNKQGITIIEIDIDDTPLVYFEE